MAKRVLFDYLKRFFYTDEMIISVGSRTSRLARAQVNEVLEELRRFHPTISFQVQAIKTTGDLDQTTSLRTLDKTNFFTRELDEMLLAGTCRITLHSAKDLPADIPEGIRCIAMTKGLDPSDALVLRPGETVREGFVIATSSKRREDAVKAMYPGLKFIDLRGTIDERLQKLEDGTADGVVLAECALIRLQLTHLPRLKIAGESTVHQGRLAILARTDDYEMEELFQCVNYIPV